MKRIPLTQGKFALVDDEDYKWLNQYKWHALKDKHTFYAVRGICLNGKMKRIFMHREITQALPNEETDHRNHNGLHNWRDNLRTCTRSENARNRKPSKSCSSRYKGVRWYKRNHNWNAQIGKNGKQYHIGYFTSEIEAAKAYDAKAKELFGEFAYLNFQGA